MSETYRTMIGTWEAELPVVPISEDKAVALLMTIDHGVAFIERVGKELAGLFADEDIDVVVTAATLGIPVALEVSRALGLDDYVVLQKSRKIHLGDALTADLTSITSEGRQNLLLDRARLGAIAGRRTLFVDDVVSTGSSALAAVRLLREAGADVVGAGFLLDEGGAGSRALEDIGVPVRTLGTIPILER